MSWDDEPLRENPDGTAADEGLVRSRVKLRQLLSDNSVDTAAWPSEREEALFAEVLREESCLEARELQACPAGPQARTGVCRVRHFLRAQVYSPESRVEGCFLFKKWEQQAGSLRRERNELPTATLYAGEVPLTDETLAPCHRAVGTMFQHLEDWHFQPGLNSESVSASPLRPVAVESCRFVSHHCDEPRPSEEYPGILDEDNFHLVKILCHGLPSESFASLCYEQGQHSGLARVAGWCWISLPKALGEQWRAVNVLETRVFAASRPWGNFREALGELSADLSRGRALLEGDSRGVEASSLAETVQRCLSLAQKAKAEHSEALASAAASAYNNPRVQSFVRTTARKETAQVDEGLQMSEQQLRRGVQGEKSWLQGDARRGTALIGQCLVLDRASSGQDSPRSRSPQLPSPRGIRPIAEDNLGSEPGNGCNATRGEFTRLAMLLGRQAEEQATTLALLKAALKVAQGNGSSQSPAVSPRKSPAVSPRQGGRSGFSKPSMRVLGAAQPDEETLALLSPRPTVPSQGTAVILDVCRAPFEDALAGMAGVLATELQDVAVCCEGSDGSDSSNGDADGDGAEMGHLPSSVSEVWDGGQQAGLMPLTSLEVHPRQSELWDGDADAVDSTRVDDRVPEKDGLPSMDDVYLTEAARQQQMCLVSFEPSGLRTLRPTKQQRFTVSGVSEAVKVGAAIATCDAALDTVPELSAVEVSALGPTSPRLAAERRSSRLPRSFTVDLTHVPLPVIADDGE